MSFQLYFLVLFYVSFSECFGEGNQVSRDYGLSSCYWIVTDMTDVDWILLSLTTITQCIYKDQRKQSSCRHIAVKLN